MRTKFLAIFSIVFLILIAVASAGTMQLSNANNRLILKITENDISLAAGKIFFKIPEALSLYQPEGIGFLNNVYAVKGNNSNLEIQFFDPIATNKLGQLDIPFTGPYGTYTVQITKIEIYNKSDYLIPFNQPLQTRITISPSVSQPPSGGGGGTIGSGAGGATVFEPEVTPATSGTSGAGGAEEQQQKISTVNKNQTETTKGQITFPPLVPVASGLLLVIILIYIIYQMMHQHKETALQSIPINR